MMSEPNGKKWNWLYHYPKSSYMQLSVKGTRIHARTIFGRSIGENARTPEQLAEDFGEAVREAIEYCESDPPEIREDYEDEDRQTAEAKRRGVPNIVWDASDVAQHRRP